MFFWSVLFGVFLAVHHVSGGFRSCKELKDNIGIDEDGIYFLRSEEGYEYQAYCDMTTDEGGWTLVASIHENNIKGRCTVDDLWSSQQGKLQANGDGNWNNRVIFGTVEGATSEDYKNPGYYDDPIVKNIAVWHVPNIVRIPDWKRTAHLRYHTTNDYFTQKTLYDVFEEMRLERPSDLSGNLCQRGMTIPITYDKGSNAFAKAMHGSLVQAEIDPGFVTLRPVNKNGIPFAMCPGVKIKDSSSACSFQHYCVGGAGFPSAEFARVCGDFNNLDGKGEGQPAGWIATTDLTASSILIFYR